MPDNFAASTFATWFAERDRGECWEWPYARTAKGYGRLNVPGKGPVRLHRHAWELANGRPIPIGLVAMHVCDNPPCVNPAHIEIGRPADNSADMVRKGRSPIGERSGRAKLTIDEARRIRSADGSPSEVAKAFGVSVNTVNRIRRRALVGGWRAA